MQEVSGSIPLGSTISRQSPPQTIPHYRQGREMVETSGITAPRESATWRQRRGRPAVREARRRQCICRAGKHSVRETVRSRPSTSPSRLRNPHDLDQICLSRNNFCLFPFRFHAKRALRRPCSQPQQSGCAYNPALKVRKAGRRGTDGLVVLYRSAHEQRFAN
jgi:hypothetical protein